MGLDIKGQKRFISHKGCFDVDGEERLLEEKDIEGNCCAALTAAADNHNTVFIKDLK